MKINTLSPDGPVTPLSMRAYVTHKHVRDGSCGTNGSLIHGGTKLKATKSLPIGE